MRTRMLLALFAIALGVAPESEGPSRPQWLLW